MRRRAARSAAAGIRWLSEHAIDEPQALGGESGGIGDDSAERVVARPDGFHWLAPGGRQEFGPFESHEDALADMLATDMDGVSQPGTLLHEAEEEIGITDWIDPETGEPPEGQSPPHLEVQ